jgi:hypothetical protein
MMGKAFSKTNRVAQITLYKPHGKAYEAAAIRARAHKQGGCDAPADKKANDVLACKSRTAGNHYSHMTIKVYLTSN